MDVTRWDSKVLAVGGAVLLALSAGFLWTELSVPLTVLPAIVAVIGSVLAVRSRGSKLVRLGGPILLLAASVGGGLWYAASKSPVLLPGLGLVLVGAIVAVWRSEHDATTDLGRLDGALRWHGLAVATIAASWASYFEFFTLGVAADELARRLVPTLVWMGLGTFLVVRARRRGLAPMRDAGFVLVAIAAGKALLYDTTHLDGFARIGGFALAGVLLLGGAVLTGRNERSR